MDIFGNSEDGSSGEVNASTGTFTDNVTIGGNLTVNGTENIMNVTKVEIEDPLVKLGKGNTADTLDSGWYEEYNDSGTKYRGLIYDASDSNYYLSDGLTTEPASGQTYNTNGNLKINNLLVTDKINRSTNGGSLKIGGETTTNQIELGRTGQALSCRGSVDVDQRLQITGATISKYLNSDTSDSSFTNLYLGTADGSALNGVDSFSNNVFISRSGKDTNIQGNLKIAGTLDTTAAAALSIGETSANAINISKTGVDTTVKGNLKVDGTNTCTGTITANGGIGVAENQAICFRDPWWCMGVDKYGAITGEKLTQRTLAISIANDVAGGGLQIVPNFNGTVSTPPILEIDGNSRKTYINDTLQIDGNITTDASINRTTAGTLVIGDNATNTTAVDISSSGDLTTVKGNLQVDGTSTNTGKINANDGMLLPISKSICFKDNYTCQGVDIFGVITNEKLTQQTLQVSFPNNVVGSGIQFVPNFNGVVSTPPILEIDGNSRKTYINDTLQIDGNITTDASINRTTAGALTIGDNGTNTTSINIGSSGKLTNIIGPLYFPQPIAECYAEDNTNSTTITTQNTWTKVNITTTANADNNMFTHTSNRLTYTGSTTRIMHAGVTITFKSVSNQNTDWSFGVGKNGTHLTGSKVRFRSVSNTEYYSTAIHIFAKMVANDYLEVFVQNNTGTTDVVVSDINMFLMASAYNPN